MKLIFDSSTVIHNYPGKFHNDEGNVFKLQLITSTNVYYGNYHASNGLIEELLENEPFQWESESITTLRNSITQGLPPWN